MASAAVQMVRERLSGGHDLLPVVRSVRDCGVIRARGKARDRYERGVMTGYLTGEYVGVGVCDYRLSDKGRKVIGAWVALSR